LIVAEDHFLVYVKVQVLVVWQTTLVLEA